MPSDTDYLDAVQNGDTETAQRMVDQAAKAAGYTVGPVYHGTAEKFWRFDPKQRPGDTSTYGEGLMFFTSSEKLAKEYASLGSQEYRKAGADVTKARNEFDDVASKLFPSVSLDYLETSGFNVANEALQYGEITRKEYDEFTRVSDNLYNAVKKHGDFGFEQFNPRIIKSYLRIENPVSKKIEGGPFYASWNLHLPEMFDEMKKSGSDGFIAEGVYDSPYGSEIKSTVYAVKDPSQIKSADPITRDDAGNVIPLSKRFQASSEDIRFMPDYSGEHRAPGRDSGAPLDNLNGVYPDDVYGPNAARYYGHESGSQTDKAAVRIIQATKGKPDAPVKVFRAIPKSIESNEINPGDWITTIKSYAVQHGEGPLGGDYKILEKTVPAGDLYTDGNSIFEFGYDPKFMPQPDSSMPGAYSFQGGYRAIPGKTKGSLRIYGPAGSLIGIAASLDEAQRILRRKSK